MEIVITDPYLSSFSGHCFGYDKSVIEELHKRGILVQLYASSDVSKEIQHEIHAIPFFKFLSKGLSSILPRNVWLVFTEYKNVFKKIAPDSIIFLPNFFSGKPLFLFSLYVFFSRQKKYKKIILLDRLLPDNPQRLFFYRLSYFLLKKEMAKGKIVFTTDSEIIAQWFSVNLSKKVYVLPIPHVQSVDAIPRGATNNVTRIFFPGEARIEKGILTLLSTVELMANENKFDDFELIIQYNSNHRDQHSNQITERLEALSKKANLTVLSTLSFNEYYQQFAYADIILTPYMAKSTKGIEGYYARTSGIFSEAVAAAKPVITTKETWMSYQLEQLDSGISVDENSPEQLAEAILKMRNSIEEFKIKLQRLR